jgi:hypothetical protein
MRYRRWDAISFNLNKYLAIGKWKDGLLCVKEMPISPGFFSPRMQAHRWNPGVTWLNYAGSGYLALVTARKVHDFPGFMLTCQAVWEQPLDTLLSWCEPGVSSQVTDGPVFPGWDLHLCLLRSMRWNSSYQIMEGPKMERTFYSQNFELKAYQRELFTSSV